VNDACAAPGAAHDRNSCEGAGECTFTEKTGQLVNTRYNSAASDPRHDGDGSALDLLCKEAQGELKKSSQMGDISGLIPQRICLKNRSQCPGGVPSDRFSINHHNKLSCSKCYQQFGVRSGEDPGDNNAALAAMEPTRDDPAGGETGGIWITGNTNGFVNEGQYNRMMCPECPTDACVDDEEWESVPTGLSFYPLAACDGCSRAGHRDRAGWSAATDPTHTCAGVARGYHDYYALKWAEDALDIDGIGSNGVPKTAFEACPTSTSSNCPNYPTLPSSRSRVAGWYNRETAVPHPDSLPTGSPSTYLFDPSSGVWDQSTPVAPDYSKLNCPATMGLANS